jgi:hypothetical protein
MSFAVGQTVWCFHRGRALTRERFVQVRIDAPAQGHDGLYWVIWGGGNYREFVAAAEDLGTFEELNRRWPAPVAKERSPEPAAAVEQMALFG